MTATAGHRCPGLLPNQRPWVDPSTVSAPALKLYRLLERLSRRLGYAHLRLEPSERRPGKSLSEMYGRCARHVRRLLSELIEAGWVIRQCDGRMLHITPAVRIPEVRKLTRHPGPKKPFVASKEPAGQLDTEEVQALSQGGRMSGPMSGLKGGNVRSPERCTLLQKRRRETTTDKQPSGMTDTCPVGSVAVVSSPEASKASPEAQGEPDKRVQLLSEVLPADEARSIGKEAKAKDWSEELILGVIAAYTAQRQNIRSAGAWFRAALRNEFKAPLPPATHPSDMKPGFEPIRPALVSVASLERKPAQPSAQPSEGTTQGREYFREKREALTQREATEAPSSLLPDPGKTLASGSGTARPGSEPIRTEQASSSAPEPSQSSPEVQLVEATAEQVSRAIQAAKDELKRLPPNLQRKPLASIEEKGVDSPHVKGKLLRIIEEDRIAVSLPPIGHKQKHAATMQEARANVYRDIAQFIEEGDGF